VKAYNVEEIEALLESLESQYDVRVPVIYIDGTRSLGAPGDGTLALKGGVVLNKITSVFFPQLEVVLATSGGQQIEVPPPPDKPLLVVGLTAEDSECLEFIDKFFTTDYPDSVYLRRRANSLAVCVSGRSGTNGEFHKIAGSRCDLELICDGENFLLAAYSLPGNMLLDQFKGGKTVSNKVLDDLMAESAALATDDLEMIQAASKLLLKNKVPDEFWQKISDRCIACTSCNLACPSCTCFDVFDRESADGGVERWRLWDSCQLDGFTREASGHNPMGDEKLRTRRRIHHRLAADVVKWGHITCYLCGRCDEVCPAGIGIKAVCREMIEEYGSK